MGSERFPAIVLRALRRGLTPAQIVEAYDVLPEEVPRMPAPGTQEHAVLVALCEGRDAVPGLSADRFRAALYRLRNKALVRGLDPVVRVVGPATVRPPRSGRRPWRPDPSVHPQPGEAPARAVARAHGVSAPTVRAHCERYGITPWHRRAGRSS